MPLAALKHKPESTAVYEKASPTLLSLQPNNPPPDPKKATEGWGELVQHLQAKLSSLLMWRYSWWNQNWSDLAEYILPRRSIWLTQSAGGIPTPNSMTRGREINKSIIDPTATYAARVCSAGLVNGLASRSRPWFKMTSGIARQETDAEGKKWLDDTEDRMYGILHSSNFYDSFAQEGEDVVVFGTGPQIIYEDEQDIIHCYNPCVGEYFLANSGTNRTNGFYRQFLQTVEQCVDFFGTDTPPEDIKALWSQKGSGLQTERIIAHSIEPNYAVGPNKVGVIPGGYTWREVYWMYGQNSAEPLSMRGFHDQPFTVSRWSAQGNDAYGRGPGMDVLPDVMQLQVMTRRLNEAIEKLVRPPLLADMSMKNQPSSSLPGHVTYVPKLDAGTGMRSLYQVNPEIKEMAETIAALEQRIRVGLFNDVFMAITNLPGDQRTATEISARISEAMQVLGPVIESMMGVLKQKLKRIYNIMKRRGFIDPLPRSLQNVPLGIDFISTLALAQRAASTGSMERLLALIGNMAQTYPEAKAKLDPYIYIDKMAAMLGTPQEIVVSTDQARQIVKVQQDAAKATAQMNALHGAAQTASVSADAANTLANTTVGSSQTALNQLLGVSGNA